MFPKSINKLIKVTHKMTANDCESFSKSLHLYIMMDQWEQGNEGYSLRTNKIQINSWSTTRVITGNQ